MKTHIRSATRRPGGDRKVGAREREGEGDGFLGVQNVLYSDLPPAPTPLTRDYFRNFVVASEEMMSTSDSNILYQPVDHPSSPPHHVRLTHPRSL